MWASFTLSWHSCTRGLTASKLSQAVFPGLPIFLCTWHVTKAWEANCSKLAHPTGDLLPRPSGPAQRDDDACRDAASDQSRPGRHVDAYEAEFADNPALVKYADHWRPKLCVPLLDVWVLSQSCVAVWCRSIGTLGLQGQLCIVHVVGMIYEPNCLEPSEHTGYDR
jgi:hypothetical protein